MKVSRPKKNEPDIIGTVIGVDLPAFSRPTFADSVVWPDDITDLTAKNLTDMMGKYTALLCYAESIKAKYEQLVIRAEAGLQSRGLKIYMDDPKIANLEKWRRDSVIASDEGMIILRSRLTVAKTLVSQAEMHVKNYERQISALSRELSRKMSTGDGQRTQGFV